MYKGTEVSRDRAHSIWRTECSLAKLVCCLSAGVGQEEQRYEAEKMVWGRLGRVLLAILKEMKGSKKVTNHGGLAGPSGH